MKIKVQIEPQKSNTQKVKIFTEDGAFVAYVDKSLLPKGWSFYTPISITIGS